MTEARSKITVTVAVTREERKALKQLALDRDTTVSKLVRSWLREAAGMGQTDGQGC